jgi:hypothetical protein
MVGKRKYAPADTTPPTLAEVKAFLDHPENDG